MTAAETGFNDETRATVKVEKETAVWGYILRPAQNRRNMAHYLRFAAGATGCLMFAAVVLLWFGPSADGATDLMSFKSLVSGLLIAAGSLLLWFWSQGTAYEVQIDSDRSEVREVLRDRKQKMYVLRRYGFEDIGGVFLTREGHPRGFSSLMLRYRNTTQGVIIATDKDDRLHGLRDELAKDILGGYQYETRTQTPKLDIGAMPVAMAAE